MPFDLNMICFACMKKLNAPDGICPHCGHDNHNRQNTGQQLPFSVIGGKYLIGKCLGQGGFGITYLGYDITLNRRVAIKEYFPNNVAMRTAGSSELSTQGMEQRADFMTGISKFIAEAQMLVALDEIPNTVRVFDAFLANSTAYIVMDYVEGQTLSQYLEAHGGKVSMKEAMKLFAPLIDSLAALHSENIIHRDLKPANLMLRAKDGQLILLDFGAARTYLDNANGMTTFHTNGYSPKEQYVRNGLQDGRTDEYALCATIYRTITGKNPPTSVERQLHEDTIVPPSKYCMDITPKQEAALLKGMSLEINDRYPNLMQLKEALQSEPKYTRVEKPVAPTVQEWTPPRNAVPSEQKYPVQSKNTAVTTDAPLENKTRTYELDQTISANRGRITVRWTDTANRSPYKVSCKLITDSGVLTPFFWAAKSEAESTTTQKSFTIDSLAPGRKYRVRIKDCNGMTIFETYTIPDAPAFEGEEMSASSIITNVVPRWKFVSESAEEAKNCYEMVSSEIAREMGRKEYGFWYSFEYPHISREYTYLVQTVVSAPDGFTEAIIYEIVTFGTVRHNFFTLMTGETAFAHYYENNKKIIPGQWSVELYFDGQLVSRDSITVK